jgi:hypothetical protein
MDEEFMGVLLFPSLDDFYSFLECFLEIFVVSGISGVFELEEERCYLLLRFGLHRDILFIEDEKEDLQN